MSFEIEFKPVAVFHGRDKFSDEECLAALDEVVGRMHIGGIQYWLKHTKYEDLIKDAMK